MISLEPAGEVWKTDVHRRDRRPYQHVQGTHAVANQAVTSRMGAASGSDERQMPERRDNGWRRERARRTQALLGKALDVDPEYAEALGTLTDSINTGTIQGWQEAGLVESMRLPSSPTARWLRGLTTAPAWPARPTPTASCHTGSTSRSNWQIGRS